MVVHSSWIICWTIFSPALPPSHRHLAISSQFPISSGSKFLSTLLSNPVDPNDDSSPTHFTTWKLKANQSSPAHNNRSLNIDVVCVATQKKNTAWLANTEFPNLGRNAKEFLIPATLCAGQQEDNEMSTDNGEDARGAHPFSRSDGHNPICH